MSNFSTKGRTGESLDQAKELNFIGYGIHEAALSAVEVRTAKSSPSKQVILYVEGRKETDPDFKPADNSAWGGKVGKATFGSYLKTEEQENEFLDKIALLATRCGKKTEIDAINADNLEDYMAQVLKHLKGIFGYWKLCGEEYQKADGGTGTFNTVARYSFFKSMDQVDQVEADAKGVISKITVTDDSSTMTFDKANKYDFKPLVASAEADDEDEDAVADSGTPMWEEDAEEAAG
jgi:hypothetical protein